MMKKIIRPLVQKIFRTIGLRVTRNTESGHIPDYLNEASSLWSTGSPLSLSQKLKATDQLAQTVSYLAHFQQLLSKYSPSAIIDVGANRGQFAEKTRAIGYKGRILSFEPVTEFYQEIENKALLDSSWQVYNYGLSSTSCEREMAVFADGSLSSLSDINQFGASFLGEYAEEKSRVEVELRQLDDWEPEFEESSSLFLKLDTQGHDLEVLKGSRRILEKTIVVIAEISHRSIYCDQAPGNEVIAFLESIGFRPERSFLVSMDQNLQLVETDQFFVKF